MIRMEPLGLVKLAVLPLRTHVIQHPDAARKIFQVQYQAVLSDGKFHNIDRSWEHQG